ncbi:uncharacterized protein LOC127838019 [Dreissena polymorpha]|uniref:Coactosin-like protein n=1 Tax=Dreissena polymorpha TaxID=45954 RepID=A0A9D4J1C8_DREPO|nr:uncharacterized protein LOC127838019 [Dreissena polymorpha]XP_052221483.1 uncharacterized protein LOC127838019 [Dreissena polymorpha]KAH3796146.1 hypothetical protein DPMN_149713 [Dreissena polymorpha]
MSTSATFENLEEFQEAATSVRNDATDDAFVIVGHVNNNPAQVAVVKVGQNVEDIADNLDNSQVMYILARYESSFDMSKTVKFVYFRWLGEEVPFTKKGKFGVVHGSIQEKFNPYHLFIETGSVDDFKIEKIQQQLEENTGKKSKVLESTQGHQMRGFTQTQLPDRGRAAKSGPQISSEGASIQIDPQVVDAISLVRSDESPVSWVVAEYQDGNPKGPLVLTGHGEGDSQDISAALADDKPMYALYRATDMVDDITTVKFVYIIWVGNSVKPMTKAKISTHKGTLEAAFGPFHVTIFATDASDISEKIIMEKVSSASGTKSNVK